MAKRGRRKKSGTSILPLIVICIIGFLVYKANPEYWQQGRLLEDLKKGGVQKPIEEDVVQKPVERQVEEKPEIDPNVSYPGSVKGAVTIPQNALRSVSTNDPLYKIINSRFIVAYGVLPNTADSRSLIGDMRVAIEEKGLKKYAFADSFLYEQDKRKETCSSSPAYEFLCGECDRKVCLINGRKKEIIPLQASVAPVISKLDQVVKEEW